MRQERGCNTLLLTLGGALLSIAAALFASYLPDEDRLKWAVPCAVVAILAILAGSGLLCAVTHWIRKARPLEQGKRPRIGILSDYAGDAPEKVYSWAMRCPQQWKTLIEDCWDENLGVEPDVSLITTRSFLGAYHAVLNPYGGTYPERDYENRRTLGDILDFVSKGGHFVNVADVPTYWAWDTMAEKRLHSAPFVYISDQPIQPFESTPLLVRLAVSVISKTIPRGWSPVDLAERYGNLKPPDGLEIAERVALLHESVKCVIEPKLVRRRKRTESGTPFFLARFGHGKFLVNLSRLAEFENGKLVPRNPGLEELIARVLLRELTLQ